MLINNEVGVKKIDRFNDKKVPQIVLITKKVKHVVIRKYFWNKTIKGDFQLTIFIYLVNFVFFHICH